MKSPGQQRLDLFLRQYNTATIEMTYLLVYNGEDMVPRAFASIHERLDGLLKFMNYKAPHGQEGHFNADESRELLGLIDEVQELRHALKAVGQSLVVQEDYQALLAGAATWLQSSNGSTVPAGFTPARIDAYAPMMWREDAAIEVRPGLPTELKSVGEGAYATVQKFVDPNHGMTLARKKLKSTADERERDRFRREFHLMRELRHPYILEVYKFDVASWSYTMEYCDTTLEAYVAQRNNDEKFGFNTRKRIALQFLYGLNFLHRKGHLHRDLSPRNVLLRVYDEGAVMVKLADFGLAKRRGSEYTTTDTEMKGTLQDPALDSFKGFTVVNDIFAAGRVLNFIFTGRKHAEDANTPLGRIIHRCIDMNPELRYQTVMQLINDIDALELTPRKIQPFAPTA